MNNKKKIEREIKTIEAMIILYCRENHHRENVPCEKCAKIFSYACKKIQNCKLGEKKTTCAKCSIHCFKPEPRESIRRVMRYSGPRMIYKHPILAIYHLFDSFARPKQHL